MSPVGSQVVKLFSVLVRFGPRFSKFCWSGPVPGFEVFLGPGPVWSEIFKFLLVLVRTGPRFGNFPCSWSGPIPGCEIVLDPGPSWS